MTAPSPRHPWWRRKRWAAALALWLATAYPLSVGPAVYCARRGWLSYAAYDAVWSRPLVRSAPALAEDVGYGAYFVWWLKLATRHRDAASD